MHTAESKPRKPGDLELWLAEPEGLSNPELEESWKSLLSPDELAQSIQFRFDKDRWQYIAAHALLRTALSLHTGRDASHLQFSTNDFGKPNLDPHRDVHFNISHTRHLAACVVSRCGEVGFDVEGFDRAQEITELGTEVCSSQELLSIKALNDESPERSATTLWTLKEAYLKALGIGLSVPMNKVSFAFEAHGTMQVHVADKIDARVDRWSFGLLEYERHSIAIVAENLLKPDFSIWKLRGPTREVTELPRPAVTWFRSEKSSS